jgi:hypothetical protein
MSSDGENSHADKSLMILVFGRQYNSQIQRADNTMAKFKEQTIQWPNSKGRQCNGQIQRADNTIAKFKGQTIQWSNSKGRQYNG